jgi:DtxR family transcriptional regulator, Mn-dependent transcriptional regulator
MIPCKQNEGLSASLTDYLGAIFQIERSNRVARAKDIAGWLKVRKASVTGALKTLAGRDLINYSPYSYITLTPAGRNIAQEVVRRYGIVRDFFTNILHMEPEEAEANARRIEHAIDPSAVDKLVSFLEFVKLCPRTDMKWLDAFGRFCQHEPRTSDCRTCIETCSRGAGKHGE